MTKNWKTSETGAMREAIGVPYFRQLPLEALAAGAAALEYGANKYDNRNWEKGLPYQQMIDSLKRHIEDFERGRDYDDGETGSGLPHVALIMSSAMMLSASVIRGIGEDDRMPAVSEQAMTAKECAKWMQSTLDDANKIMNGEPL
jgi:diadenosine tetraphosphatase ApaH/serine/threonine PP2A family protein phosphatase